MFCRNCGAEVSETAKFCPKCGYARNVGQAVKSEIVEDGRVKHVINPKFNLLYQFLSALWSALVWLFFIGYFIVGLAVYIYFPIIPLAFLIIFISLKLLFTNMQYKNLAYNFYTTKVEYIDGFLNKEEKELKYKYVREVTMSQSILERMCDIGTIKIFTNASSGGYGGRSHNSMKGKNGIYIHCLENVQEQYKIVKQIIDEGTPED